MVSQGLGLILDISVKPMWHWRQQPWDMYARKAILCLEAFERAVERACRSPGQTELRRSSRAIPRVEGPGTRRDMDGPRAHGLRGVAWYRIDRRPAEQILADAGGRAPKLEILEVKGLEPRSRQTAPSPMRTRGAQDIGERLGCRCGPHTTRPEVVV